MTGSDGGYEAVRNPQPYYADDLVTLYHGDCRDFLPSLTADLVLTDPPYGVTYVSNSAAGKGTKPISNDGTRLSLVLNRQVIPMLTARHVLWFTRWDAWPDIWAELGQHFPLRGLLVWDKNSPGMGDLRHWGPSYELIASAGQGRIVGARDGSVLRFNGVSPSKRIHPTEKPVALLSYLIEKLGAASVLDPFAGSGSTLHAAKALGVPSVGVEMDERYCEAVATRLASVTRPDPALWGDSVSISEEVPFSGMTSWPLSPRLSTAIMDALTWDCAHRGQPVNDECVDCARLRDAILVAAEPILRAHDESCCMVGIGSDKGPHPDCPGSGA